MYPTFLVVLHLAPDGSFKSIPMSWKNGAGRRRNAAADIAAFTLPLAVPGLISAGIFSFTLSWNEFIYALAFIQSGANKTVPVAILTELVTGDVYQWGALMRRAPCSARCRSHYSIRCSWITTSRR